MNLTLSTTRNLWPLLEPRRVKPLLRSRYRHNQLASQTALTRVKRDRYIPLPAPVQLPQDQLTPQQTYTQPGQTQFIPHQTYPQPGQTQPTPQPANQVTAMPSQPARSTSNRYTPSAAPRPGVPTVPTTRSPQVHATQPTWSQPTAPRPPPPTQIPSSMSSSFVTAKGAYSSPYDLPPQIATKAKRHIPPPIPTYQQPPQGDQRPPLSANIHPSLSTAPPPRAASAQPHFPAQQQRQYLPPQGGVSTAAITVCAANCVVSSTSIPAYSGS